MGKLRKCMAPCEAVCAQRRTVPANESRWDAGAEPT